MWHGRTRIRTRVYKHCMRYYVTLSLPVLTTMKYRPTLLAIETCCSRSPFWRTLRLLNMHQLASRLVSRCCHLQPVSVPDHRKLGNGGLEGTGYAWSESFALTCADVQGAQLEVCCGFVHEFGWLGVAKVVTVVLCLAQWTCLLQRGH